MDRIRYTLLTDGSSDKMLLPVLDWLLERYLPSTAIEGQWADLDRVPAAPQKLADRVRLALELYNGDLIFIHRDAETHPPSKRRIEIQKAVVGIVHHPAVCVIPVRMQEAWFLFDEDAIRKAAGNPNGQQPLNLPSLSVVEAQPDPKRILYEVLKKASGLKGARLKKMRPQRNAHRVLQFIEDFSPLFALSAFQRLDQDLRQVISAQGWSGEV